MLQKYLVWSSAQKLDSIPLPGSNGNSVLYPVRGFKSIPDANPDPLKKNYPQEYVNFTRFMGGASYHRVDKEGRPVFIDRLVSFFLLYQVTIFFFLVHYRKVATRGRFFPLKPALKKNNFFFLKIRVYMTPKSGRTPSPQSTGLTFTSGATKCCTAL